MHDNRVTSEKSKEKMQARKKERQAELWLEWGKGQEFNVKAKTMWFENNASSPSCPRAMQMYGQQETSKNERGLRFYLASSLCGGWKQELKCS